MKKLFTVSMWVNVAAETYDEANELADQIIDRITDVSAELPIGLSGIIDIEELE